MTPEIKLKNVSDFVDVLLKDVDSEVEKESFKSLLFKNRIEFHQFPPLLDISKRSTDPVVERLSVLSKDRVTFFNRVIEVNQFLFRIARTVY